jgi:hypothetical protein
MTDTSTIHAGTHVDEMKIVVKSLYLSMAFLLERLEQAGGREAAIAAREALIENLSHGDIDMAIMEDRKTFDFVLSVVQSLPIPK